MCNNKRVISWGFQFRKEDKRRFTVNRQLKGLPLKGFCHRKKTFDMLFPFKIKTFKENGGCQENHEFKKPNV